MKINSINQTSFTGQFSPKTLARFQENLTPNEFKEVKGFRSGKKYTQIDIITVSSEPVRLMNGTQICDKATYAEFVNIKAKKPIKSRIKLADGVLPFNMNTFKLITDDLVKRGEKLISHIKLK